MVYNNMQYARRTLRRSHSSKAKMSVARSLYFYFFEKVFHAMHVGVYHILLNHIPYMYSTILLDFCGVTFLIDVWDALNSSLFSIN